MCRKVRHQNLIIESLDVCKANITKSHRDSVYVFWDYSIITTMNELTNSSIFSLVDPNLIFKGAIIYLFIVWFCIVVWVVRDITNRTQSVFLQIFSTLLVLFLTPLGIFIYLLIRPQKTLFEKIFEQEFLKLDEEVIKETQKKHHARVHADSEKK